MFKVFSNLSDCMINSEQKLGARSGNCLSTYNYWLCVCLSFSFWNRLIILLNAQIVGGQMKIRPNADIVKVLL